MPFFPVTVAGWIASCVAIIVTVAIVWLGWSIATVDMEVSRIAKELDAAVEEVAREALPTPEEEWDQAMAEHQRQKRLREHAVIYVPPERYPELKVQLEQQGYEVRVEVRGTDYTG